VLQEFPFFVCRADAAVLFISVTQSSAVFSHAILSEAEVIAIQIDRFICGHTVFGACLGV